MLESTQNIKNIIIHIASTTTLRRIFFFFFKEKKILNVTTSEGMGFNP